MSSVRLLTSPKLLKRPEIGGGGLGGSRSCCRNNYPPPRWGSASLVLSQDRDRGEVQFIVPARLASDLMASRPPLTGPPETDLNPQLPPVALEGFGEGELTDLDDRTAHILRMRSGMWDGERRTQKEVGEDLGIDPSRVSVLEKEGLRTIRHLRESQRHLREEPISPRYRWRLPRSVALRRWSESRR